MSDFLTEPLTFVRVYRLPERARLTDGYCFGGGKSISFVNVDWFEALISEGQEGVTEWIKTKQYYTAAARFLVLGDDPRFVFTIEPRDNVVKLGAAEERKSRS